MAIWQYYFKLEFNKKGYQLNCGQLKLAICDTFDKILPHTASWSKKITQFGELDSNCIELFVDHESENDKCIELSGRIDLRNVNIEFIRLIYSFSEKNNFKIIYQKKCVSKTFDEYLRSIKSSNEYKFALNPQLFISLLREEQKEE